ncbi:TonB-dependent receptor plug domain-containing protein [Puia sp. P3]|uniref:STN domain-containing protein n=1 Tax=Puia sp. P3 TaxID=3423952 RepID=UPI003D672960
MQKTADGKVVPFPKFKLLIIMKLTAIFLLVALLRVSAEGVVAQTISLHVRASPIEKVFAEIENQTHYSFIYGKKLLSTASPVSVSLDNAPLEAVLKAIFENQPLSFKITDRQIIVAAKVMVNAPAGVLPPTPTSLTVHGHVADRDGYPMPSVSVVIPGTPLGTMTNAKGEYVIRSAPENADLVFSYVGFAEQRVHINGRQEISIVLLPIQDKLDEMVIIAYGKTTRRLNTGSVVSVSADVIEKQPVQNVMVALEGRVSGVQVAQNNGVPGSNTQMQIRGQGSLNSGTIPLYVIDGVPYTNFNGGQPPQDNLDAWGISGANGGTSPFSSINPSDIQSITILKDADATAIYGAGAPMALC